MRLALIPPVSLLDYTSRTNMQLMLPHLVGNDQYAYTYKTHGKDKHQYLILDNGVAEGQLPVPEQLFALGDEYGVNEIVLPDKLGDAGATRLMTEDFLELARNFYRGRILTRPKFQFVVQGQTWAEMMHGVKFAAKHPAINIIALPRIMIATLQDDNARIKLAQTILTITDKKVHLLGGAPTVATEIRDHKWPVNVRSHDTSSPFNFAHANLTLRVNAIAKRPPDYFNCHTEEFDQERLDKNVRYLMKWCGYGV